MLLVDLLSDNYTFDYSTGDNSDRFLLHFNLLSVNDIATNSVQIYSTENQVHVDLDKVYSGEIAVYDVMGREVVKQPIESQSNVLTVSGGNFYIVTVTTDEKLFTEKVYIK